MQESIDPNQLTTALTRFGLSDREAALYVASLRRGRGTARELTRDANIDRVLGYRLLDGMRARGLMEITTERPRRYAPVPPARMFERHLRTRRDSLAEDEQLARDLQAQLLVTTSATPGGAARYQMLVGASHIYTYLGEMVDRAERNLDVMLTFRSLRDSLDHDFSRRIGPFASRNGRFRLILEYDPRLAPTLQRFRKSTRRFDRVEIREATPQPSRLTIADSREALLFLVPESKGHGSDQVAIWTDSPGFVQGQSAYFDRTWESAEPALRGSRARTPRTTRERRPPDRR